MLTGARPGRLRAIHTTTLTDALRAEGFTGQPRVVNGASELLGKIFGDLGQHARSAVGVAELPLGSPVEIELTVELT